MRPTAVAHGPVPGDLVRAATAVSVVVAVPVIGGVAGALLFLVLGGTVVPRALGLPTGLDLAFGGSLLFAAWAALLGWYDAVPWLDLLVHAVCTGLVAAVGTVALVRGRVTGAALVALTTAVGALGAVLWELGEWAGHTFLDDDIFVGYQDTVGDLAFGLLGALTAGIVLAARPTEAGRG
ncbi:hypothetical protein ACFQHV_02440 [Promicromonospora thailandica]|uniref:DUF2238 domain-containing protein n=1 Tax=Promicromonospora thailandica TaxID=765201 RepID=A0A9X2G7S3_9MICO|nr:hypothetical protein [Promicromonospora thailandica]MCP2266922.1 hypothetical protein [Promicromonospora thailandica]BFF16810.1 hypothetical protein GCM10025730_03310 [Promicromonospora thailandica]